MSGNIGTGEHSADPVETPSLKKKNMSKRATHPPRPSCEHLAEFAWWKIYIYFLKAIKLTSDTGVTLMGQYKHVYGYLSNHCYHVRMVNLPCFINGCVTHNNN